MDEDREEARIDSSCCLVKSGELLFVNLYTALYTAASGSPLERFKFTNRPPRDIIDKGDMILFNLAGDSSLVQTERHRFCRI